MSSECDAAVGHVRLAGPRGWGYAPRHSQYSVLARGLRVVQRELEKASLVEAVALGAANVCPSDGARWMRR